MSVEMHVFLETKNIPSRDEWQASINALGLPLVLDAALNPRASAGFVPCKVRGADSGFELNLDDAHALAASYATAANAAGSRDAALSFRWGGDMAEAACALGAVAALVGNHGGVAYYPDDDVVCELEALRADAAQCLADV